MAINTISGNYAPTESSIIYRDDYSGISYTRDSYVSGGYSYKESVGSDIPGYHRKIRNRELLPVTTWRQVEINNSIGESVHTSRRYNNDVHVGDGFLLGEGFYIKPNSVGEAGPGHHTFLTPSLLESFIDETDEIGANAVNRAVINLTAAKHDTLTSVAELAKTVNMFRNVGQSLGKLVEKTNLRNASDLWLEGRYGWRTLRYDLEALDDAVQHFSKASPFWRAIAGDSVPVTYTQDSTLTSSTKNRAYRTVVDGEVNYRGFAVGMRKPPSFGFNLPKTAWELVPFSFVVDWFVNVGQTIDLVSGHMASNGMYVSGLGVRVSVTHQYTLTSSPPDRTPNYTGWVNQSASVTNTCDGTMNIRVPKPPVFVPSLDVNLDRYKVLDLVGLVVQQFTREDGSYRTPYKLKKLHRKYEKFRRERRRRRSRK